MEKIKLNPGLMTEEMKERIIKDDSLYDEIDVEGSLPFILTTFRELQYRTKVNDPVKLGLPAKAKEAYTKMPEAGTTKLLWETYFKSMTVEDKEYFADVVARILKSEMEDWGFGFIKNFNLKSTYIGNGKD